MKNPLSLISSLLTRKPDPRDTQIEALTTSLLQATATTKRERTLIRQLEDSQAQLDRHVELIEEQATELGGDGVMNKRPRHLPVRPSDEVLAEIKRRYRIEGQHIKANCDYGSGRKVKKDDTVGTFEDGGRCIVMVKSRRVYLSHIAFFLSRKHWPTKRVVYLDGNHRNHSPSNIAYEG